MNRNGFIIGLIAFLCAAPAALAQTATIETGRWPSNFTTPDGQQVEQFVDIELAGDTLAVTLDVTGHGKFATSGAKFDGDHLVFTFKPGPVVLCRLRRQPNASFEGVCTDDEGGIAPMSMSPPVKAGT